MTLRTKLLSLLAPLSPEDEILPGVRLLGSSEEVGPRLLFTVDDEPLAIEVTSANAPTRAFVRTRRLRFAYVASGPVGQSRGPEICREVARRAGLREDTVFGSWDAEEHVVAADPRVREMRVDRLLEVAWYQGRLFHTLSPYVGCLIGCRYCYAQSHVAAARLLARRRTAPWGSYVDVRINAAEVLASELATTDVRTIKMCPIVSDPYQAVETRYGVTRACLETIARSGKHPSVLVLTRSALIRRDAELLGALRARAGVSLPTLDDEVRTHFEPRAASVDERLATLRALRAAGVGTMAVVQPLLPGPLDALADAIAAHCSSASVGVLDGVQGADDDFADPRHRHARDESWQSAQAERLRDMLRHRGVRLWSELPGADD